MIMEKKYKLGYCGIIGDFFDKAAYLRLKECSELCSRFVIGIPDEYVMARLYGDGRQYSAEEMKQIWSDCKWVDDVIILDAMTLQKRNIYEKLHFDVCFYGSEYGAAFEEDQAFMQEMEVDFIALMPDKIQSMREGERDALGLALENVRPNQKIVLFGTGQYFDYYMKTYGGRHAPAYAIDNSEAKWNTQKSGILIQPPSVLQTESPTEVVVIICSKKYQNMLAQIKQMGNYDYRTLLAHNEVALLDEFALAWNGEQEYVAKAHDILVKLLREFVRVCTKHGLRYYIICGTLIGVIRHQDFIPWDDDVDIAMPREDYEKLKKIAASEWKTDEFLFLNYDELGNNAFLDFFPRLFYLKEKLPVKLFGKVENKASVDVKDRMWLDIYVLDNASKNDKKHMFVMNMMKGVYALCMGHRGRIDYSEYAERLSTRYLFILKTVHQIGKCLPFKMLTGLYERLSKYAAKENCDDYYIAEAAITCIERRFKQAYFREGVQKRFRDLEVMVPLDYDGLLNAMGYHNYMEFPRLSVRKPSHYFNSDVVIW